MSTGFIWALVAGGLAVLTGGAWLVAKRVIASRASARAAKIERDDYYDRGKDKENDKRDKRFRRVHLWAKTATWLLAILAVLLTAINCGTIVHANTVAVKINVGRASGVLDSGFHWKTPWSTTEEFTTRLQTTSRLASPNEGDKQTRDCVDVKASGVEACIDTSVRWKIDYNRNDSAASNKNIMDLWSNYGTFDKITSDLIRRETERVFANVYGGYTAQDAFGGSKTAEIDGELKSQLGDLLKPYGITVDGVTLGDAHLLPDDQTRLNRLFTSQQDIMIAQNEADAAKKQAAANDNLNGSLTQQILVQRCLDAVSKMSPPPATFNCWPGGSGTPVIVQQQPAK